jgi:hypothetical protein
MVYPALLPLMRTPRLPVVDWTDAPVDLNGLVRFAERRCLVSARVPSHFQLSLLIEGAWLLTPSFAMNISVLWKCVHVGHQTLDAICYTLCDLVAINPGTTELNKVIWNDCRGFSNLSYTIHLRLGYVVPLMDQEILKSFLLWCAVCSSYAFLRLERSWLRCRRTAMRRRSVCLHIMIVGQSCWCL